MQPNLALPLLAALAAGDNLGSRLRAMDVDFGQKPKSIHRAERMRRRQKNKQAKNSRRRNRGR